MPWVVGIDEAGYGPNLGPLVQAAVALHLPDDDHSGWETLKPVVRRCHEKADGRLLIDDSKKVYTRGGLAGLELASYGLFGTIPQPVSAFLKYAEQESRDDLARECWFNQSEQLPIEVAADSLLEAMGNWADSYRPGTMALRTLLVPTPRFNRICDETGTKAAVLSNGLVSLLRSILDVGEVGIQEYENQPLLFLCDKHGGRNFYGAMLQEAFPNGWIVPERESADESRYRVELLDRPITIIFRPRADGDSIAVALASMLCKYLREVCMRQFNLFWAKHVPGIRPTAGYPLDARRFFDEIKPAMARLGLTDDQVWRKR
jgi:ribonuclease HII